MGCETLELAEGALVVVLLPVPQGHVVPLDLGEFGLKGQDTLGLCARIHFAKACQHTGDVLLVFLAQGLAAGVGFEVVISVRQAEPGLIEIDGMAVRCLGISTDPEAERGAAPQLARAGEGASQSVLIADLIDFAEQGQQRCGALGIPTSLIQIAGVEIADLPGLGIGGGLGIKPFHQHSYIRQGFVPEHIEGTIGGPVIRDLGGGQPVTVHVAEEVITGFDPGIHVGQCQARVLVCRVRRLTATG